MRPVDTLNPRKHHQLVQAEKIKKFLLPDTLKMYSLDLSVLRFYFKTLYKLLKFRLQNTLLCVFFFKSNAQIKHLYDHKLVKAAKQLEVKGYNKQFNRNQSETM